MRPRLRPGGLLLVQDHVLPEDGEAACYVDLFEKVRDPGHNRAFTESEWRVMFEDAGLTVEQAERLVKRHEFVSWAERQGCAPETIAQLVDMMKNAPPLAAEWMMMENIGTPDASFANHHLIIAGRK